MNFLQDAACTISANTYGGIVIDFNGGCFRGGYTIWQTIGGQWAIQKGNSRLYTYPSLCQALHKFSELSQPTDSTSPPIHAGASPPASSQ